MDTRDDNRTIIGAVGGAIVPDRVCKYAQENGIIVLTQSGESVEVAKTPEGFKPKTW